MAVTFDRRIVARYRILETAMARRELVRDSSTEKNKGKIVEAQKVAREKLDAELPGRPPT